MPSDALGTIGAMMPDETDATDAYELPAFLTAACPRLGTRVAPLGYDQALDAHAAGQLLHVEHVTAGLLCILPAAYDVTIHRFTPDQARWNAHLIRTRGGA